MSGLKYYSYAGAGEWARENLGYSQAVRIGDRIECSGQGESPTADDLQNPPARGKTTYRNPGGWTFENGTLSISGDLETEIAQAFANVETALRDAGGKGWSQVYRVNSYHTALSPEVTALMTKNFKNWMPDHKPIWTEIGVKELGLPEMRVEIEVVAYDP
ncbi:hypothetical protein ACRE_051690 [Hapsidospora chrysogenum ATCC 11550]|uniref:RutC family protein-like protein n=1 Tax=Hapsidospora chrysogenum (strain ATCC 11550 / CBS 779.69 / DSM 880 / IAM 14645 / JCM 23072 / IMI 49137) TaxID=857340 RepID=A0A086T407_HAPC1|nr:hypothetical protein ACRE_051690 [Hapsidospora chrysogenum ATCC 11550]